MTREGLMWALAGYLAGTFPSTWVVATLKRSARVTTQADRTVGEADAHLLIARHLGAGWTALAAGLDVAKAFAVVSAARVIGDLSPAWLAVVGVAAVAGHSFPPYLRRMAGRGMAGMAGVYLALLPLEMVVAGVTIVVGGALRATGLASTVALATVPVAAIVLGRPGAYVLMSAAILVLIVGRRLEGVGRVIRSGVPPARAIVYRAVLDATRRRERAGEGIRPRASEERSGRGASPAPTPSGGRLRKGMTVIVQKYGGTSVADTDRIRAVADRVVAAKRQGYDVLVVVSAMGETTDQLLEMAHRLTPLPNGRELDLLLTAGERIAMSLLAIAINQTGYAAASYTGSQAGIITDTVHGKAKIKEIRPARILESLQRGNIVIVAGFQGISERPVLDVTTLGRGGSDTTAVAMAAALGAEFCEIYTDVPGVYTADPRVVPNARKLHAVSYEEMLELAASGAQVLQLRSVEYARTHRVRVHVRSSFTGEPGTWVTEEDVRMEQAIISGVAHDLSEAKITIRGVPDRPGVAAAIFRAAADEGAFVDMVVQNISYDGRTDISFLVPKLDLPRLAPVMDRVAAETGGLGVSVDDEIAKVSLIGAGIKSHPAVVADMFATLAEEGINIDMISTSSIRISCLIRAGDAERAVRALHARFAIAEEVGAREKHPT